MARRRRKVDYSFRISGLRKAGIAVGKTATTTKRKREVSKLWRQYSGYINPKNGFTKVKLTSSQKSKLSKLYPSSQFYKNSIYVQNKKGEKITILKSGRLRLTKGSTIREDFSTKICDFMRNPKACLEQISKTLERPVDTLQFTANFHGYTGKTVLKVRLKDFVNYLTKFSGEAKDKNPYFKKHFSIRVYYEKRKGRRKPSVKQTSRVLRKMWKNNRSRG